LCGITDVKQLTFFGIAGSTDEQEQYTKLNLKLQIFKANNWISTKQSEILITFHTKW
jgi:hypothetical protein